MTTTAIPELPGLNCGLCGYRTCDDMAANLAHKPDLLKRCIYLSDNRYDNSSGPQTKTCNSSVSSLGEFSGSENPCVDCRQPVKSPSPHVSWVDSLGRDFDFYLEHFPEDPGPREIILPHNPMLTREMEIKKGEVLIGRPLGMSCGCPITHCGVTMDVDHRTGVIVWCVTGPLGPRQHGYKDLGYYIAEGYEGMIKDSRSEVKIGMRYFFQPRMCMLQWRHSGLVNYLNRTPNGLQVRLEGLWIG